MDGVGITGTATGMGATSSTTRTCTSRTATTIADGTIPAATGIASTTITTTTGTRTPITTGTKIRTTTGTRTTTETRTVTTGTTLIGIKTRTKAATRITPIAARARVTGPKPRIAFPKAIAASAIPPAVDAPTRSAVLARAATRGPTAIAGARVLPAAAREEGAAVASGA